MDVAESFEQQTAGAPGISALLKTFPGVGGLEMFTAELKRWFTKPDPWSDVADLARELFETLPAPAHNTPYYEALVFCLARVEQAIAKNVPNKDTYGQYQIWRKELACQLDYGRLHELLYRLTTTDGTSWEQGWIPKISPADCGELTPVGRLCSNDYAEINHGLRRTRDHHAVFMSCIILADYKLTAWGVTQQYFMFATTTCTVQRFASTLFDGFAHDPRTLQAGMRFVDLGWTFFGDACRNVSRAHRTYTFQVVLCRAVTYLNDLYASNERGLEWVTPPGSCFEYEGQSAGGALVFRQVLPSGESAHTLR